MIHCQHLLRVGIKIVEVKNGSFKYEKEWTISL